MTDHTATPSGLLDRFRENVRTLKALRKVSDTQIAEHGQYASRQLLNHRITGRTVPDLDDLARIAAALDIDPGIILAPLDEIMLWIKNNPDYQPPTMPAPSDGRDLRPVTDAPTKATAKKAAGRRRVAPAR
jgi:transcriptional regulator with XRE-family HTH domain